MNNTLKQHEYLDIKRNIERDGTKKLIAICVNSKSANYLYGTLKNVISMLYKLPDGRAFSCIVECIS